MEKTNIGLLKNVVSMVLLFSLGFTLIAKMNDIPISLKSYIPPILIGSAVGHLIWQRNAKAIMALELEKRVKEKTKSLERANALKEYSDHLTGLFTDILRHDLLNPVGVIINLTDIMEEDENLKDSHELAVIKRNALKLEGLINNATVFGKIESTREVEKERLELGEVVTTAIKNLEMYAPEKEAKIEFAPGEKYELRASPFIGSAIENLITNAIKYGPEGQEIKIVISDEGDNLMVKVTDQGEGVPDKFKEAIFDRFTRKDKLGVKGSGLGLAIVKRIAELHGGRVWVEDNPCGVGSVFSLSLPKKEERGLK